eukprot:6462388-Amphidinium_carterae.1
MEQKSLRDSIASWSPRRLLKSGVDIRLCESDRIITALVMESCHVVDPLIVNATANDAKKVVKSSSKTCA